ncbi:MAG TPA: type IV toxin-antitoxin system AbiEi family antitoxin domain-containing protein [Longimicrobiales bacterium]
MSRRALESRIAEIAATQNGVVTRAQLRSAGLSASAIQRRTAERRFIPLYRGVYGITSFLPANARLTAAVLACGEGSVVSHRSAAELWGLLPTTAGVVDVTLFDRAHRCPRGIRVHRMRLEPGERTAHHGIPTTTPARTLADIAAHVDRDTLELAAAVAERERLVTRAELTVLPERHRGRPGIPTVRALVDRIAEPSLTRSEAERRFLALIRRARLPTPQANVPVEEFEVDFLWPDHDLAVEVDGYRYHGSRVRFEADRQRATRLASLGIHVVPLTWRQIVDDELVTAVQLAQALTRSRGRP